LPEELRKELKSNRQSIREKLQNPLLMLHIIEAKDFDNTIAAFGVSFPGNVLSIDQTVNLKINTVYYKNLLKELEENSDD